MKLHPLMAKAATEMTTVVRAVKPDQLDAPTPCSEYDVRALVTHLLFWGPALEGAARKRPAPRDPSAEQKRDLTGGDWQARYVRQVDALVDAWADPAAWEGTSSIGRGELPASAYGAMTFVELVFHAWDLARATGQDFHCDDDVAEAIYQVMSRMGEMGRSMGAFGDEVAVPESALPLDRALGLAGRDPDWPA